MFNNLGLAIGMGLKFYASVVKGLKLKVRKKKQIYEKRDSLTGTFLWILWNFLEHFFTEQLWMSVSAVYEDLCYNLTFWKRSIFSNSSRVVVVRILC